MAIHFAPVTFSVSRSLLLMPSLLLFLQRFQICLTCYNGLPHLLTSFWSTLPVSICSPSQSPFYPRTVMAHLTHGNMQIASPLATLPSQLLPIAPNMVLLFPCVSFFFFDLDVGSLLTLLFAYPLCLSLLLKSVSYNLERPEGWHSFPS